MNQNNKYNFSLTGASALIKVTIIIATIFHKLELPAKVELFSRNIIFNTKTIIEMFHSFFLKLEVKDKK